MREVRIHRRGEGRLSRGALVPHAGRLARRDSTPGKGAPRPARNGADERLGLEVAAIHAESRQRYGSPRIHAELGARGCHTSRKRVARLMRERGLAARRRRRFRVTTDSKHAFPVAPNLLAREFEQPAPDVAVGHRHHVHPDGRRLAVPGRRPRSLLALRRGLGHEREHHPGADSGRPRHGPGPAAAAARACSITPIGAASTPAATTRRCSRRKASRAA